MTGRGALGIEAIREDVEEKPVSIEVDGALLRGELYLPVGKVRFPAAILLHGLAAGRKVMRPTAVELAKSGVAALIYDLRGHGDSEGVYAGEGPHDVRESYRWLQAQEGVLPNRIGIVGHSFGGRLAIQAASGEPTPAAVVALAPAPDRMCDPEQAMTPDAEQFFRNPPSEVYEYPAAVSPGFSAWDWTMWRMTQHMRLNGYRLRFRWDGTIARWNQPALDEAVRERRPYPLLLVQGAWDQYGLYRDTLRLAQLALPPCDLWVISGGLHATPYGWMARRRWTRWLVRRLRTWPPIPAGDDAKELEKNN